MGSGIPGLEQVLRWCIAGALAYYALRVLAAVLMAGVALARPQYRAAAISVAPWALRPIVRRVLAGGLLSVALAAPAAMAAPADCAGAGGGLPVLDRGEVCAPLPSPADRAPAAVPDRAPAVATEAAPAQRPATAGSARYTVVPGDSLWRIAADVLGPTADPAAVAQAWPGLWQANESVIGPDPSHIVAGTALIIPADMAGTVAP